MFELFMSRFSGQSTKLTGQYNANGCYSSTVAAAMQAVASACRQQQAASATGSVGQQQPVAPESVLFRTPKYLADLKLVKERQTKQFQQQQQQMTAQQRQQQQQQQPAKNDQQGLQQQVTKDLWKMI